MSNVFIVHGHDHAALYKLKDWVRGLGLTPVVLVDEPNAGLTVIEKFEKYAKKSDFAIAILTPDDRQAIDLPDSEKFRARQNVIFEMGWFMAKIGRKNVVLAHKGQVELPSDVLGVLYLPFRDSITEVLDAIRDEMRSRGLI